MQGQSKCETSSFTLPCSCCGPAATPGHGQPRPLVPPALPREEPRHLGASLLRGSMAPSPCWEEMTALTATGLSLMWFSSVLNRRAEAKPCRDSPASSHACLRCWAHEKCSEGRSLYLYGEFCASLLCSRNLLHEAGFPPACSSSASPELDEKPRVPHSLYPPGTLGSRPPTTPHHRERAEHGTAPTWLQTRVLPSTRPLPCLPGTLLPSLRAEQAAPSVPAASQSESTRSSQSPRQPKSFPRSSAGCRHVCNRNMSQAFGKKTKGKGLSPCPPSHAAGRAGARGAVASCLWWCFLFRLGAGQAILGVVVP